MKSKNSKRRGNQEGTITKREDGRWEARMSLPNGKRKSFYAATQEEVLKKMRKAQQDVDAGLPVVFDKQSVETYLKSWLEIKKHRIDASSHARYFRYLLSINPIIGSLALSKLSPQHLQHLYAALLEKGWAAGTVGLVHGMMHDALKQAVRLGIVQRNVSDMVDPPRRVEKEMQVLTQEQVKILLNAAKENWFEAVYVVVLATGLRAGEIFALQWGDIDFAQGKLLVQRGWQRTNTETFLSLPKTSHGRRTIVLSRVALEALKRQRSRVDDLRSRMGDLWDDKYSLVFPNHRGHPVEFQSFSNTHLRSLLKRAFLPIIRFHDLRHTFATLLLSKGVNIKVVSEMLGHANVSITLRVYAHVLPHMQQSAANLIDEIIE
jgi:integrase